MEAARHAEAFAPNAMLLERLQKPRPLFTAGNRIHMNAMPLAINLLVPWGLFTFCSAVASFSLMYKRPDVAWTLLALAFVACAMFVYLALWHRRHDPDPTWYSFMAVMLCLAAAVGTGIGLCNYAAYTKPYSEIQDMKVLGHVDVGKELGLNVMDAGIVHFAEGNRVDDMRGWHFKHDSVYCVAPIVANASMLTHSYDFWAVGKDCCATGSSDFRCSGWQAIGAHSAIRALDDDSLKYYRLAVKQAETLYGVVSSHPLFFYWTQDPQQEVYSWTKRCFRVFLFASACFFVFALVAVVAAAWRFSLLGRAKSVYKYRNHFARDVGLQPHFAFGDAGDYPQPTYGGLGPYAY
mmetsp:Transcript_112721/g.318570  ORF Transcript_112721/g.318570 Transcript_112721/m.318570 type:complete len:350 (-) Transcript_112721:70-1119(-)